VVVATHALSPAKISRVTILDAVEKHMEVIVDDTQLSLAIGKKGQNVRLAAKLLGWRIDIKSEEEKRQEVESRMELVVPGAPVSVLLEHGLTETLVEKLNAAGIGMVEKLGAMTPEQLEEIPGIDSEMVESIQQAVVSYYGQFETAESAPGQEGAPPAARAVSEEGQAAAEEGAAVAAEGAAATEESPAAAEAGEPVKKNEADAETPASSTTETEAAPEQSVRIREPGPAGEA